MMHLWRLLLLVAIAGLFPSISEAAEVPGRVTADTQAPTAPSELTAIAVSSSQIELSWTASTGNTAVTGYRIYRNGAQVTTTTSNSYSDTGLEASTSYSYTVAAYDATPNTSAKSESAAATTFPPGSTKPRIGARVEVTNGDRSWINDRASPQVL